MAAVISFLKKTKQELRHLFLLCSFPKPINPFFNITLWIANQCFIGILTTQIEEGHYYSKKKLRL